MRVSRAILCLLGTLGVVACQVGWSAAHTPVATSPNGATIRIDAGGSTWVVELLAVRDDGLLVQLLSERIAFAAWAAIRQVEFTRGDLGFDRVVGGAPPADGVRESMRLVSRYVYGIDDAQLARLLERHGQEEPVVLAGGASGGGDRVPASASPDFLLALRQAVRPYRDRSEAIAAGYRLLGPDFPGMGEHWVHPGLVVAGRVDPERPAVLSYVDVDGSPRLVGVAFTLPLGPDEEPPDRPFPRDAWHDHTGAVDEETLLLNHPASMHHGGAGFRLSMVHVWTELENPAGVLAQNNWVLPFWKRRLPAPEGLSTRAARGLSLEGDGREFYATLVSRAAELTPGERDAVDGAIGRHAARAAAWLRARRRSSADADLRDLEEIWTSLWAEVREAVRPETWSHLAPLAGPDSASRGVASPRPGRRR